MAHQEIVLGIFEYHVDRFVLQDDLSKRDEVPMMQLPVELLVSFLARLQYP